MVKWFKNQKFRIKLFVAFGIFFLVILLINGIINYYLSFSNTKNLIDNSISNIVDGVYTTVEASVEASIKNYLRGIAEKGKNYASYCYEEYVIRISKEYFGKPFEKSQEYAEYLKKYLANQNEATEDDFPASSYYEEAEQKFTERMGPTVASLDFKSSPEYKQLKRFILNRKVGKIGITGYLAGVNTEGILSIHPLSEGANAMQLEFMPEAVRIAKEEGHGYLEYMWKNTGEKNWRAKAGYLEYFEPWDVIVWASSYKEEFNSLIDVNSFKKEILSIKLAETDYPYIFDLDGNIVLHEIFKKGRSILTETNTATGEKFIQQMIKNIQKEISKNQENQQEIKIGALLKENTEHSFSKNWIHYKWKSPDEKEARWKTVCYTYYPTMKWIIAHGTYDNEIYADVKSQSLIIVLISVISILIIIPVIMLISKMVTKTLNDTINTIEEISKGDLTKRIETDSKDELGTLALHFNKFLEQINMFINSMKKTSDNSKLIGNKLNNNSSQSAQSINQISEEMQKMKDKSNNLNNEIFSSVSSVKQISASINEMAQSIEGQSESVERSSASIEQISTSLHNIKDMVIEKKSLSDNLSHKAKTASSQMLTSVEAINKISESTNDMLELITVINNITDQTNMLAMNAAIEAAHAGESGRGFAVVAEEIRKLAEITSENAKQIGNTLKKEVENIHNATEINNIASDSFNEIVNGINEIVKTILEIISGIEELSEGSNEIVKDLENLTEVTNTIKTNSANINDGTVSINNRMTNVSEISENNNSVMKSISDEINTISDSIRELSEIGKINEGNLSSIDSQLSKFKTDDQENSSDAENVVGMQEV